MNTKPDGTEGWTRWAILGSVATLLFVCAGCGASQAEKDAAKEKPVIDGPEPGFEDPAHVATGAVDSMVGADGQDALVWECTNHDPPHQGASPGALKGAHGCAGFVGVPQ